MLVKNFRPSNPDTQYTEESIITDFKYTRPIVEKQGEEYVVGSKTEEVTFKVDRKVPKLGMLIVGLGGNNGTTVFGMVEANKQKMTWQQRDRVVEANYYGSLTQVATSRLGRIGNEDVYTKFGNLLPMVDPDDVVIGGWDINGMNLGDAMKRASVFDPELQEKLYPYMKEVVPMPGVYYADFIAENQRERADHILPGSKKDHLTAIREQLRDFKANNGCDQLVVMWSGNTERYCGLVDGINDTKENLLKAIDDDSEYISPSQIYAIACILEGVPYINGSPQNTLIKSVMDLAYEHNVLIAGNDFKSGQTKIKSVLADYLVGAGLKMRSIVSYNHLGNNDGRNLSSQACFRSKEISKGGVVDDVIDSNEILYPDESHHPDHCVVIKYVPFVGDSKRAMDEYTSEIAMGGFNTLVLHNTCEDSLLAAPIILDLVLLTELFTRVYYKTSEMDDFEQTDCILSILGYLLKQPLFAEGQPVINALFRQRVCLENTMKAIAGLPIDTEIGLEQRTCL
ncbi:hypothetical protein PCE1_002970 [Barthelona sp. PCE]